MPHPLSIVSNRFKTLLLICITLLFTQCKNEQQPEVIEINDVLPQSKRDYTYTDSSDTTIKIDSFIIQLSAHLNRPLEQFTPTSDERINDWKYIPSRFNPDTTISSEFYLDSTFYQFKSWSFKDSILSINAFYNWLDCFGEKCKEIALGDSTYISNHSFLLLQRNENISFILSDQSIDVKVWREFLAADAQKPKWNYILSQGHRGISKWLIYPEQQGP
jgi:hypothetical protein